MTDFRQLNDTFLKTLGPQKYKSTDSSAFLSFVLFCRNLLLPLPAFLLLPAWAGQSAQQLLCQWVSRERQQRTKRLKLTSLPSALTSSTAPPPTTTSRALSSRRSAMTRRVQVKRKSDLKFLNIIIWYVSPCNMFLLHHHHHSQTS